MWGFASAALVLTLTGRIWNRSARRGPIHSAARMLVPVVLLAAHYGLKQRLPNFPPGEALDWTLWAAVAAVFVPDLWAGALRQQLTVWGTLLLALCYAILRPRIGYLEPGAAVALFLGAWAFWLLASVKVDPEAPGLMEGVLLVSMGAAGCLAHSYVGAALMAGALCFAVGGAWVMGSLGLGSVPAAWVLTPWLVAVGGLVLSGVAYGELATLPALALALAATAGCGFRRLFPSFWTRARALVIVSLLAFVANLLAWPTPSAEGDLGESGYSVAPWALSPTPYSVEEAFWGSPQEPQKRPSGAIASPQAVQNVPLGTSRLRDSPQALQNLPGATTAEQLGQAVPGVAGARLSPPRGSRTSICAIPRPTPRPAPPRSPAAPPSPSPPPPAAIPSPAPIMALPAAKRW